MSGLVGEEGKEYRAKRMRTGMQPSVTRREVKPVSRGGGDVRSDRRWKGSAPCEVRNEGCVGRQRDGLAHGNKL